MDFPVEFSVIKFDLTTWLAGLYLLAIVVSYWLIFRKHHKRNHVEIFELVNLVTKYFVVTTVSILLIIFGIDCIITANQYIETRRDVIAGVSLGIVIISATIIYYIKYIKSSLIDYDMEVREATNKKSLRIGEILQLICLILIILLPLWRIPYFIKVFDDRKELIIDLVRSFAISFAAMFVLYNMNPLEFREYLSKKFSGEEAKEDLKEEVEEKVVEEKPKKTSGAKKTTGAKKSTTKQASKSKSKTTQTKKSTTSKSKKSTKKKEN